MSPWSHLVQLPPSSETGVYYCLGLAQERVRAQYGVSLRFTKFEAQPGDCPSSGGKCLDAIADILEDGRTGLGVEFKLYSSDLLTDVLKFPNFRPDVLICWQHDAPGAEEFVGKLLIEVGPCMTTQHIELPAIPADELVAEYLKHCVPRAKEVIRQILGAAPLGLWPRRPKGVRQLSEIRLTLGSRQIARLNHYTAPALNLRVPPDHPALERLGTRSVTRNKDSVTLRLQDLDDAQVSLVIEGLPRDDPASDGVPAPPIPAGPLTPD